MKGYGHFIAPKIVEELEEDPEVKGQPTDPTRFDAEDLMEREASYGRTGFALQFLLDPSLSDAYRYPLKLNDLVVMSLNPREGPEKPVWAASAENMITDLPNVGMPGDRFYGPVTLGDGSWGPYTGSVLAIDPSGRGRDETGYAVVKFLASQLFVTEAGGFKGGYDKQTLGQLARIAKDNKVNRIIIEANFGDGMFNQLLKPVLSEAGYPVTIEEVRHNKQKELRIIDTLEPLLSSHRLILDPKIIINDYNTLSQRGGSTADNLSYLLMYQLSRLTRDKGSLRHDDSLDALSIACGYWVEHLAQSVDEAAAVLKNERVDRELEKFLEGVAGRKPVENLWVNL